MRAPEQVQEEEFCRWLVALDAGSQEPGSDGLPNDSQLDPVVNQRLQGAAECLALLACVWPRANLAETLEAPLSDDPTEEIREVARRLAEAREKWISTGSEIPSQPIGRFRILRELGRGGFGVVYLADDPLLDRKVALKVQRPEGVIVPQLRQRFLREAKAAAGLTHPNIVAVHEVSDAGLICWIVAEYCRGTSLATWLHRPHEPASPQAAARLIARLADGVDYAHRQGVLHRDIKPSNVLLEPQPTSDLDCVEPLDHFVPKLTDFGLAKWMDREGAESQSGTILGTPSYMAPEQLEGRGDRLGPASDVYGLGMILYEVLTGGPAFPGQFDRATLRQVLLAEPARVRRIRRDVPRDLEAIVLKCIDKQPRRRYATAGDLALDLRRFLAGEPTRARPLGAVEWVWKWMRRQPAWAALLIVSVLGPLAVAIVVAQKNTQLREALTNTRQQERETRQQHQIARRQAEQVRNHLYAAHMKLVWEAYQNNDARLMTDTLALYEQGEFRRRRGFEYWYLWGLCHAERATLRGHLEDVYSVIYSPDGATLATAGSDGCVRLWNAQSGALLDVMQGQQVEVNGIAFSPSGELLASAGDDRTVRIWDVHERKELARLAEDSGEVVAVQFSPDGKQLAAGTHGGQVSLWETTSWMRVESLRRHHERVEAIAFSPDSRLLASVSNDGSENVKIWDLRAGREHVELAGHRWSVEGLAFADNGRQLITADVIGVVRTWNVDSGEETGAQRRHATRIHGIAISPHDGHFATSGAEGRIVMSQGPSQGELFDLRGHTDEVWSVAFSPDGRTLASASRDGTVKLWDPQKNPEHRWVRRHFGPGHPAAVAPDGTWIAEGDPQGKVAIWELAADEQDREPGNDRSSENARMKLRETRSFGKPGAAVLSLAVAPNGTLLAAGYDDRTVRLFDLVNHQEQGVLHELKAAARVLKFSSDGKLLVAAGDQVQAWEFGDEAPSSLDTQMAGSTVNVIHDGIDYPFQVIWSPGTNQPQAIVARWSRSPNQELMATLADNAIHVVNATSGKDDKRLSGLHRNDYSIVFAPDAKTVVTQSGGRLTFWNYASGLEMFSVELPVDVTHLSFSRDQRTLIAWQQTLDGTLDLFHLSTPAAASGDSCGK